jgi:hypothetical protein
MGDLDLSELMREQMEIIGRVMTKTMQADAERMDAWYRSLPPLPPAPKPTTWKRLGQWHWRIRERIAQWIYPHSCSEDW